MERNGCQTDKNKKNNKNYRFVGRCSLVTCSECLLHQEGTTIGRPGHLSADGDISFLETRSPIVSQTIFLVHVYVI